MREVDPGHNYRLQEYDGSGQQSLTFMKRVGEQYPGNTSKHSGTNCQEVLRVLIARVKYLHNQLPDDCNYIIIRNLRASLLEFELRAARRHGRELKLDPTINAIEDQPHCLKCGHIGCGGIHA